MDQIREFFTPFMGQLVWAVRRGHGSFLTMEFGLPHLAVREPIIARPETSERARRTLLRRHVNVSGDWHFWVQYGDWKISTAEGILTSDDRPGSQLDECLRDLDGQRLLAVRLGSRERSCAFDFDLGAALEIWPSEKIPDDQWSLHSWNGDIVSCRNDGVLVSEKADPTQRVYKPLEVTWPSGSP